MEHPRPSPAQAPGRGAEVHPDLVSLLVAAAEAPPEWAALVTPQARLDGDLMLDECELATLAVLLRERFGAGADLAALRAGLDLAGLESLTVGALERALLPGRVSG
ncbi:hypothetical protein GCM10018781_44700 [Kitasatospora indigofera]|uniref:Acyl carrier protein n=1 Tax=Kitasatospora indigofera TaxID=67307 RepID=A0A919G0W9_9ACTN|nr:hypothetical protein [Kitasatospora indigofera]GHH75573.1 hypothetical protein GCM10018781_44700 [Kitasatospora indigofera]